MRELLRIVSRCAVVAVLPACGGSSGGGDDDTNTADPGDGSGSAGRIFTIEPGEDATADALSAFYQAGSGDTIEFACGFFEFDTGLLLQNTENVKIVGCGRDATVLSFRESDTAEGLSISNVRGITVEDLTVADTPGDGIKIKSSDYVTYRNVRTMWSSQGNPVTADSYPASMQYACPETIYEPTTYEPSPDNGRYGIYPVESSNILLENVQSLGASDAGIYVGQSDDVIIRDSHALYNVAGFEVENTQRSDMHDNVAECNTVGYIIYDLPGLTQYGYVARMYDNLARNNNFENFAAGGFVAQVPEGSGLITLAFDQIEVFNNTFKDHQTGGIIITSYELVGDDGDMRQDIYTEALHIHDNEFINSGYNPPLPNAEDLEAVIVDGNDSSLLPTLVRLKNLLVGADILWDGLYDEPNDECAYPEGVPANDRGKPLYEDTEVHPDCRYNQYKFDDAGERKKPSMWICIENNLHSGSPAAPDFANFHGLEGLEVLDLTGDPSLLTDQDYLGSLFGGLPNLLASRDVSPHQCQAEYGETLPPLPPTELDEYEPSPNAEPPPTDEEVAELCGRDTGGDVNWEALGRVDCPELSQYHLFEDPSDPSAQPNGGTPYDLNTQLFSDYAVKYRVLFMPEGESAQFRDGGDGPNATFVFPVGTVLTKTFSFPDESEGSVDHVETRLLIKREDDDGTAHWVGLPYIWTERDGKRVAELALGGGETSVSWHYTDPDSGELHTGSTDSYSIPHATQCQSCHANTHRPAGAAPIGPKPRNLNKPYSYAGSGTTRNQLAYWRERGLLVGGPADLAVDPNTQIATAVERLPRFDVPGDSGETAGSDADVEARVRAYLEVNCAHCHNNGGGASNTGLYLDALREVNGSYGICTPPTAAGAGSGGRPYDITPSSSADSILSYRMGEAGNVEVQMPPIARSVNHGEAKALVEQWIDQVVDDSYPNAGCDAGGGFLGFLGGTG